MDVASGCMTQQLNRRTASRGSEMVLRYEARLVFCNVTISNLIEWQPRAALDDVLQHAGYDIIQRYAI